MPEPESWDGWRSVRCQIRGHNFFHPVLTANTRLGCSSTHDELAARLSEEEAQALHRAMFAKPVQISCKNAAMLLELASKVAYAPLKQAVRTFYGRLAVTAERANAPRRARAQRALDKVEQGARERSTKQRTRQSKSAMESRQPRSRSMPQQWRRRHRSATRRWQRPATSAMQRWQLPPQSARGRWLSPSASTRRRCRSVSEQELHWLIRVAVLRALRTALPS